MKSRIVTLLATPVIAAFIAVVPASMTSSAEAAARPSVGIKALQQAAEPGEAIGFRVNARAVRAGAPVRLMRLNDSTWVTVAKTRLDRDRTVRMRARAGAHETAYMACVTLKGRATCSSAVGVATEAPTRPSTGAAMTDEDRRAAIQRLITAVNDERAARGIAPLALDEAQSAVAQDKARRYYQTGEAPSFEGFSSDAGYVCAGSEMDKALTPVIMEKWLDASVTRLAVGYFFDGGSSFDGTDAAWITVTLH